MSVTAQHITQPAHLQASCTSSWSTCSHPLIRNGQGMSVLQMTDGSCIFGPIAFLSSPIRWQNCEGNGCVCSAGSSVMLCLRLRMHRGINLDGGASARAAIEAAHKAGGKIGAFYCESILSCGGQVEILHLTGTNAA